jgi:hypothetical protein
LIKLICFYRISTPSDLIVIFTTVECVLQLGDTPIHLASSNGDLDVVRYLIEQCGADVHAKDKVSEFD